MEKAIRRYWPVFVLPTLIAFIIGFVWPFIWGAGLSFCKFTTVKNVQFAGLSNYAMIWSDNTFTHAFWFTAAFTVVSTQCAPHKKYARCAQRCTQKGNQNPPKSFCQ